MKPLEQGINTKNESVSLKQLENLILLRDFCRNHKWPRLSQWNHWITSKKPIAQQCVKKIGGRYLIDLDAFKKYVANANLDEKP